MMSTTGTSLATTSSSMRHSTTLNPEELDLWELCYYGGVTIDPQVFRILVDLLRMDVHPKAVLDVLKSIAPHSKFAPNSDQKAAKPSSNIRIEKSVPATKSQSSNKISSQKLKSVSGSDTGSHKSIQSSNRSSSIERKGVRSKPGPSKSSATLPVTKPSEKLKSNITSRR